VRNTAEEANTKRSIELVNVLTTRQVASKLEVSLTTVYQYIYSGALKARKLGGTGTRRHWRIKEADLEAFVNNGKEAGPDTPNQK